MNTVVAVESRMLWLLAALLALLSALVYAPGMTGGFAFDDFPNILENAAITQGDLSPAGLVNVIESGVAGPFKRPLPMLSFAVNYYFAGLAPYAWKLTNLVIHVINGWLVLLFVGQLLASPVLRDFRFSATENVTLAAFTACLWLVHPLNLTSVLFVVQRMNSLAAGFSLLALIVYCIGRRRMIAGAGGRAVVCIAFPACVVIGALCKENALLALPLAAVVEGCFFRFAAAHRADRHALGVLFVLTVAIPAVGLIGYLALHPEWLLAQSGGRGFSPLERGLSETRVLVFYVAMLCVPRLDRLGLYHDDFALSTGLLHPGSTLIAVIAVAATLIAALGSVRRYPLAAFPVLWFAVGHAMESTVLPLELVHEHRNYLPGAGFCFGFACTIVMLARRLRLRWLPRVAGGLVIALFAVITFIRAGDWSDPVTLATIEAARNPDSFRTVYELGRVRYGLYLMHGDEGNFAASLETLERAASLDRNAKRPLLELIKLSHRHGRVPPPGTRAELIARYRRALFRHNDWVDLQRLVKCRSRSECDIPVNFVIDLYAAALQNETITTHARAQVMADFAVLYVNTLREFEPAIALLDDAIALRPDEMRFRVLLAETLVLGRRDGRAAEVLDTIDEDAGLLSIGNVDARRLDQLKQILGQRISSTPD